MRGGKSGLKLELNPAPATNKFKGLADFSKPFFSCLAHCWHKSRQQTAGSHNQLEIAVLRLNCATTVPNEGRP